MGTVKYTIKFLSEWQIGSGLSGGAAMDNVMLKDEYGLPYIPGKTIKGLLRDALEEIHEVQSEKCTSEAISRLFGEKKEGDNKMYKNDFGTEAHFTNAELREQERSEIIYNKLETYLYRTLSSTSIDKNGVAKPKSLRTFEVCVPVILHGVIHGVSTEHQELLKMAMRWTRAIGMKRNRGFGKCIMNLEKG